MPYNICNGCGSVYADTKENCPCCGQPGTEALGGFSLTPRTGEVPPAPAGERAGHGLTLRQLLVTTAVAAAALVIGTMIGAASDAPAREAASPRERAADRESAAAYIADRLADRTTGGNFILSLEEN